MAATTFKKYVYPNGVKTKDGPIKGRSLMSEMMSGDTGALTANIIQGVQANQGLRKQIVRSGEEEQEPTMAKIDVARSIFTAMVNAPNMSRKQIIHTMMKRAHVTHSTAVSYYERLAKEAGITNSDQFDQSGAVQGPGIAAGGAPTPGNPANVGQQQPMDQQQEPEQPEEIQHTHPDDPDRQGIIRTVKKAHLVYKRQTPEGTFEELWMYNIGPDMRDELKVRREILAGTDIPAQKTTSPDGQQSYVLTTMGNAQLLLIKGLSQ